MVVKAWEEKLFFLGGAAVATAHKRNGKFPKGRSVFSSFGPISEPQEAERTAMSLGVYQTNDTSVTARGSLGPHGGR